MPPQATAVPLLARAAGSAGMAGGQAIDLASVGLALTEGQLRDMHQRKTGACCWPVCDGRCCARVRLPAHWRALQTLAAHRLAFQVVDDILDVTADSATLGKTAGRDAAQTNPPTYLMEPASRATRRTCWRRPWARWTACWRPAPVRGGR